MILIVDEEFEGLIPPLSAEELANLRASIAAEGARVPIDVWEGHDVILDGHNRYRICRELGLSFIVRHVSLPDREAVKAWMILNQRSRRNLSPDQNLILDIRAGKVADSKHPKAKKCAELAPELQARVLKGEMTAAVAINISRKPINTPRQTRAPKGRIHVVIGDTQIKPGVPTEHLSWIGRYIVEQFQNQNIAIVHLGDHWDMPSLSSYDFGKKAIEGRRYKDDVDSGNAAMALLDAPIAEAMASGKWKPERHFLMGNHEERILRACNDNAQFDGALSLDDLNTCGWTRHDFLAPVTIDGIVYAHYFIAQGTGKPLGGENAETRLKTVGVSFTMGHQQGRKWAERQTADGRRQCALILGSTYLHDEDYRGPQGNANWRGICICHQVENGSYDPMFVSLDYLCRRFEGKTLADFMKTKVA